MQYMPYVTATMEDVKVSGIPDDETREKILTNLYLIFFDGKRWKRGELETAHELLELVLNTEVGPKRKNKST